MPQSLPDQPPFVSASEVGEAAFCPYSLYLKRQGVRPDPRAREALRRGSGGHARWATGEARTHGLAPYRPGRWVALAGVIALFVLLLFVLF